MNGKSGVNALYINVERVQSNGAYHAAIKPFCQEPLPILAISSRAHGRIRKISSTSRFPQLEKCSQEWQEMVVHANHRCRPHGRAIVYEASGLIAYTNEAFGIVW